MINSLDDLRPGDIMISGQSTAPNKILVYLGQLLLGQQFRIGKFAAGHAGIISTDGRLIEAMPSGARIRELRESDWSEQHRYFRLPEDVIGQREDAAIIGAAMIGTPYSFFSYVYLAAYLAGFQPEWLAKLIDRRVETDVVLAWGITHKLGLPKEAICSVLAEQAWTLAGKKVVRGTHPQVVTPGMLTEQLLTTPGVIIGGLGWAD